MNTDVKALEACVTSVQEAMDAVRGGADRLELCVSLDVGGLTPPADLVRAVKAGVSAPVFCMVRPRLGPFQPRPGDVEAMAETIAILREAGASGLVLGPLGDGNRPDYPAVRRLVERAGGRPVTFHRAFDEGPDLLAELPGLIDAGVARVLTGGGAGTAWDGRAMLGRLVDAAQDRIGIIAAGRVRADHAARLVSETGVGELHARAVAFPALGRVFGRSDVFGRRRVR